MDEVKDGYKPVIGLEIHVQLKTKSKMFGPAPMGEAEEANVNIDEIVTGEPGVLPVVNKEAVRLGVMAGLALNCTIPEFSKFDRKHYFYPDLPKGYQISQYDEPIAQKGYVNVTMPDGRIKRVGITRAHLEEDAGKNVHPEGLPYSLVDYNRAGAPLLEIVTDPDLETAEEARLFLEELQRIVRYVGASDADMEKGSMRCEPNISVRKPGEEGLPKYKVEVKNINSFRFAEAAINYEIPRQIEILEQGGMPKQVTMGWNEKESVTVEQRSKEEANDYRYFPDPDLPVLQFTPEYLDDLRSRMPELPAAKRVRFAEEYGLKPADIDTLINSKTLTYYFEDVVSELREWQTSDDAAKKLDIQKLISKAANWCLQDFSAALNSANLKDPYESRVSPENFAELIVMIENGTISGSAAKTVFKVMFEKGGEPDNIMQDLGLAQVSDEGAIEAIIDQVLAENAKAVADYKAGAEKSFGFLVGQTMKALKGQGNPGKVNELLRKKLL
ncbi:MAG TPA: Asp-tRNA(Asn)/Glu-tRNA(Gln) amidotransferase subunit GatB [Patescibacteria group bacterium]|nr:Asp-tRNA(Asn)/Glu-tRNA(Gln) amidotransferase subunit GatB [Patescibacteria group bacterium]